MSEAVITSAEETQPGRQIDLALSAYVIFAANRHQQAHHPLTEHIAQSVAATDAVFFSALEGLSKQDQAVFWQRAKESIKDKEE